MMPSLFTDAVRRMSRRKSSVIASGDVILCDWGISSADRNAGDRAMATFNERIGNAPSAPSANAGRLGHRIVIWSGRQENFETPLPVRVVQWKVPRTAELNCRVRMVTEEDSATEVL